ncbi:MAG: hypothetical protein O2877_02360, partial [bacterium]|nr:hypothetical protein [bacterium]
MERLNIPLYGNHTTRRGRWAVWRWGVLVLFFCLLGGITHLKVTQNSLPEIAPEHTALMIHLRPSRAQWPTILAAVGNESLTNSGVTLNELHPYINKSVSFFLTSSGKRFVAITGDIDEQTITKLRAYGTSIQKIDDNAYLFGDQETNLEAAPFTKSSSKLSRLLPKFAGNIAILSKDPTILTIRTNKKGLAID